MKQYMKEPWFELLVNAAKTLKRSGAAAQLGVSAPLITQVLNGSGKYGEGEASTEKIAEKVIHTFGRFTCPHLSSQAANGADVVITAEQCRSYAHRPAPTGSPRDMQHWQACNACPHKAHTAPPTQREVKPRKRQSPAQEAP